MRLIRNKIKSIPDGIKKFGVKAFILFIAWKLLYQSILIPIQQPDKWLTETTSLLTSIFLSNSRNDGVYSVIHYPSEQLSQYSIISKSIILRNNKKVIGISNACDALELIILYTAFLFCFPLKIKRVLCFSLIGIFVIFVCNLLRCIFISSINLSGHLQLADMAHHYLFKLIMYLLIFFGWVWYCKDINIEKI